ncbi:MAG TPA: cbb3-type cytochrome c oxidase subunit I [Armatimonadota bacterium]|nr:cbb3-type cytochrome c oxidase subunit I [Armatimonadota bacterium]
MKLWNQRFQLDRLLDDRPGSAARNWMISGAFWMFVGVTLGLLLAIFLAAPDFLGGHRYLEFGRIRPLHVNTVWYGFLSMTLLGAGLHYVPQLCRTTLYSERIANLAMWIWNISQVAGMICVITGYTSAHEYAEYPIPVDVTGLFALLLVIYVTYRTIDQRKEPLLYVSIWYYAGALLWFLTSWAFLGGTGQRYGVYDAVWTWFYGHQVFGLWVTPLAIGVTYYIVPREAKRPLFSHSLSLIGFWMLVTTYAPVGAHHLLQAPIPSWEKVIAIVQSVMLLIPVYVFLTNIWVTMRGRIGRIEESLALRFVVAGTIWYWVVSTQGTLEALISVQRLTHFTNFVVGHSHNGLLGFAGFIAAGAIYDVLPQVTGHPIYSARLANFQYWLMLIGQTGFFFILTIAGLIQGSAWLNGESVYRVLVELHIYMIWRAWVGTFIVMGAYVQFYNVVMTVRGARPQREEYEPVIGYADQELLAAQGLPAGNGYAAQTGISKP